MNWFLIIHISATVLALLCMCSAELSSELKDHLRQITPEYEEHLKRAFQNEGIHRQGIMGHREEIKLDDVLVTIDNNIVELQNLKLPSKPDFRVNQFSVDLSMLTLSMTLNLGNIRVSGDYVANNKSLYPFLPITHSGKIDFTLENVIASGRVGLLIKEDSFTVENYDIEYRPEGVSVAIIYFKDNSQVPVVNEIIAKKLEETLANTFWAELENTLTFLLHLQLGAVIVEDSVTELLGDEDAELREYSRQQAVKANRLLDSLLFSAKNKIVSDATQSLSIPELEVFFYGRQAGKQRGSIEARLGYMQDLSTLSRIKDISLYENESEVIIYGSIHLREFKFGYEKYTSEYLKAVVEGNIRAIIHQNKVFLKVSVSKNQEQCLAQLEKIQVRTVENIEVAVSGLGSLSWLAGKVESWIIGVLRKQGLPVLEQNIASAFEHALKSTDCISLLNN